jgi:pyrimidine deaminase RibD-like protein
VTAARVHVVEAELELSDGLDPAAVGAAVTVELCGHWEHEGPCRWPHNSAIDGARFRTLFVAVDDEAAAVRERIASALRGAGAWRVVVLRDRPVAGTERALAGRLLSGPRAKG